MSLIRCVQLLNRKSSNLLNSFKQTTVYYSDDKKSSDDDNNNNKEGESNKENDKKTSKQTKGASKTISPESQSRLNELLKKLSKRSTLGIVKEVQGTKPLGYRKLRQVQKLDAKETKPPRSIDDAAKAVAEELGDENVKDQILTPFEANQRGPDFLECVFI